MTFLLPVYLNDIPSSRIAGSFVAIESLSAVLSLICEGVHFGTFLLLGNLEASSFRIRNGNTACKAQFNGYGNSVDERRERNE